MESGEREEESVVGRVEREEKRGGKSEEWSEEWRKVENGEKSGVGVVGVVRRKHGVRGASRKARGKARILKAKREWHGHSTMASTFLLLV